MTIQTIPERLAGILAPNYQRRLILNPSTLTRALRDSIHLPTPHYLIVPTDSLSAFIAYCEIVYDELTYHRQRTTIFRGHADASWKLVPSLMRENIFPSEDPQSTEVESLEKELLDQFERRALPHTRNPPQGSGARWRWAALAQHHNLPTRFLDWTHRPTAALYFAVAYESPSNQKIDSCVWAIQRPPSYYEVQKLHAERVRPSEPFVQTDEWPRPQLDKDMPVCIYDPPHVSPRITAQQACFTVHPSHYLRHYFEWIEGVRVIFLIESSHRKSMRASLERLGINRESFFPDLDGIAAHLAEQIKPNYGPTSNARTPFVADRGDA